MKIIKNAKVKVENGFISIKIPLSLINNIAKTRDWSILDKIKGIWKDKKIDALDYQREIRKEWK